MPPKDKYECSVTEQSKSKEKGNRLLIVCDCVDPSFLEAAASGAGLSLLPSFLSGPGEVGGSGALTSICDLSAGGIGKAWGRSCPRARTCSGSGDSCMGSRAHSKPRTDSMNPRSCAGTWCVPGRWNRHRAVSCEDSRPTLETLPSAIFFPFALVPGGKLRKSKPHMLISVPHGDPAASPASPMPWSGGLRLIENV